MRWFWQPSPEAKALAAAIEQDAGISFTSACTIQLHRTKLKLIGFAGGGCGVEIDDRWVMRGADRRIISKAMRRRFYREQVDANTRALERAAKLFSESLWAGAKS